MSKVNEKVRTAAKRRPTQSEMEDSKKRLDQLLNGRPREHDRYQIAIDLIEWAQKDDSYNLNGFTAETLIDPSKLINWAKEDESFRQALNIAKGILGKRREQGLTEGKVHQKAYDLNATVYDRYLKDERREDIDYALERKAAIDQRNGMAPNDDSIDKLIDGLKQLKNAPKPKAD